MAFISENKKKIVSELAALCREYPIIGTVNMENMPAQQLQSMRFQLRDKVKLVMSKKRLMKIVLEQVKDEKKGIEHLAKHLVGMPALIFTKESPFKLSKILMRNKSKAHAKAGQIAPNDILISKGATGFNPGPIIGEFGMVGIKTGVEGGKVVIKEDSIIVKKGEVINQKVAEILTRLNIKPMEIGLDLTAAYDEGLIYSKDVLAIDESFYLNMLQDAERKAFNLSFNIAYPTKENIGMLIGKAFRDAKALGVSRNIFDDQIVQQLFLNAERSVLNLKNMIGFDVKHKEVVKKELPVKRALPEKTESDTNRDTNKRSDAIDKNVSEMVKKTKEFMEKKKVTADDIIREVEEKGDKAESVKKEANEMKDIEDLANELKKKGTLRK